MINRYTPGVLAATNKLIDAVYTGNLSEAIAAISEGADVNCRITREKNKRYRLASDEQLTQTLTTHSESTECGDTRVVDRVDAVYEVPMVHTTTLLNTLARKEIAGLSNIIPLTHCLIKSGADLGAIDCMSHWIRWGEGSACNYFQNTPLINAIACHHTEFAFVYLNYLNELDEDTKKSILNYKDKFIAGFHTALEFAIRRGFSGLATAILRAGADPNPQAFAYSYAGKSPLHMACMILGYAKDQASEEEWLPELGSDLELILELIHRGAHYTLGVNTVVYQSDVIRHPRDLFQAVDANIVPMTAFDHIDVSVRNLSGRNVNYLSSCSGRALGPTRHFQIKHPFREEDIFLTDISYQGGSERRIAYLTSDTYLRRDKMVIQHALLKRILNDYQSEFGHDEIVEVDIPPNHIREIVDTLLVHRHAEWFNDRLQCAGIIYNPNKNVKLISMPDLADNPYFNRQLITPWTPVIHDGTITQRFSHKAVAGPSAASDASAAGSIDNRIIQLPHYSALNFYIRIIQHHLNTENIRGSVIGFLMLGEFLHATFPGAQSLEEIQRCIGPYVELFSELSIQHSMIVNALISARNSMATTPPDELSEREKLDWDISRMPESWQRQLRDVHLGAFAYLTILDNRGNLHEERNKTDDYKKVVSQTVTILNELAHHAGNSSRVLLDVDETAALSPAVRGEMGVGYIWNDALLNALYRVGSRDIYLLTNYNVRAAKDVENPEVMTPSRYRLVLELVSRGFRIHDVLTPYDFDYNNGPGRYYLDCIFPVEFQAYSAPTFDAKNDPLFQMMVERENTWKGKMASDFRPKGKGYEQLLLSLSEKLSPTELDRILSKGFIYIDDARHYLAEVSNQLVEKDNTILETSLTAIRCTPFPLLKDELQYMAEFTQQSLSSKRQAQLALDSASPQRGFMRFFRKSTEAAYLNDLIQFALTNCHGKSLYLLAAAIKEGRGIQMDLMTAERLFQLAIIFLEDEELRHNALVNYVDLHELISNSPDSVFDTDNRIHADKLFSEKFSEAITQKDAVYFSRLASSYEAIIGRDCSRLIEADETTLKALRSRLENNIHKAIQYYDLAIAFLMRYQKISDSPAERQLFEDTWVQARTQIMLKKVELTNQAHVDESYSSGLASAGPA